MVIHAELARRRRSRNQRRDVRSKMRLLTTGKAPGSRSTPVFIHDLSTGGLLLETDDKLEIGETIEVELPRTGVKEAEIVWSSGNFFGCRFPHPVPPAAVSAAMLKALPAGSSGTEIGDPSRDHARFGERLAALREGKGWNLHKLAEQLGVSRQAVWYWESGQRLPRAELFKKIAAVFKVDEKHLLENAPSSPPAADREDLIATLRRDVAALNDVPESTVRIIIQIEHSLPR